MQRSNDENVELYRLFVVIVLKSYTQKLRKILRKFQPNFQHYAKKIEARAKDDCCFTSFIKFPFRKQTG